MGDDLYSVLGLTKSASADDIRRAYKKMALRWHPDKNPDDRAHAENMFKQVSHAYEVLSKEDTRRLYDQGGMAAVNGETEPSNPSDFPGASRGSQSGRTGGSGTFREEDFHSFFGETSGPGFRRGGGGGRGGFVFHDPFDIFRQFFGGEDPFSSAFWNDDDDFGFGGPSRARGNQQGQGQRQTSRGFAHDDFGFGFHSMGMGGFGFGGGLFGGGLFGPGSLHHQMLMGHGMGMGLGDGSTVMMSSSSSFGGGGGSQGQSTSVSTVIRNGQKITRTVRKTFDAQGNVHEDVDERVEDLNGHRLAGGAGVDTSHRLQYGSHQASPTMHHQSNAHFDHSTLDSLLQRTSAQHHNPTPGRSVSTNVPVRGHVSLPTGSPVHAQVGSVHHPASTTSVHQATTHASRSTAGGTNGTTAFRPHPVSGTHTTSPSATHASVPRTTAQPSVHSQHSVNAAHPAHASTLQGGASRRSFSTAAGVRGTQRANPSAPQAHEFMHY
jgi:DnaJ family protein B protein 6